MTKAFLVSKILFGFAINFLSMSLRPPSCEKGECIQLLAVRKISRPANEGLLHRVSGLGRETRNMSGGTRFGIFRSCVLIRSSVPTTDTDRILFNILQQNEALP